MWRILVVQCWFCAMAWAGPQITLVIGAQAPELEKQAAAQLAQDLRLLFEAETKTQTNLPAEGHRILVGSPTTNAAIPASLWPPDLPDQGHVLRSSEHGLIVGGGSPQATLWAASELAYRFGLRPLLHGDVQPIEAIAFSLDGFDSVLLPQSEVRAWDGFNGQAFGLDSWSLDECTLLLRQLAKLKFTHFVLPQTVTPFAPLAVDGDSAGRGAFKGAKVFSNPDVTDVVTQIRKQAPDFGLAVLDADVVTPGEVVHLGAPVLSVLPQFSLEKLALDLKGKPRVIARVVAPGDLNAAAHYLSRAAFDSSLTPEQALSGLVTPICGEGVAERLWKGFTEIEKAAQLIATHDPNLGVPAPDAFARLLQIKEAAPPWISEVKALYASAMNEMYRANTRTRDGARPFILYHAKRLGFTVSYLAALEFLYPAHADATDEEAFEGALEAIYNALSAQADAARDASDRGVIALLNEHGYRALLKATEP